LIPVLNTFKITTVLHLEHKSIMTEYHSTTALDTGRQDKTHVATSKSSARMPTVLPIQKKI